MIGISQVLHEINTPLEGGSPVVFSITWVKKSGVGRGKSKTVKLARKQSATGKNPTGRRRGLYLKTSKTLLLDNLEEANNPAPFYVGIETITHYNGQRVRH